MPDGSLKTPDPAATGEVVEATSPSRRAVCSACRKLPECFGRLFCPRRDLA